MSKPWYVKLGLEFLFFTVAVPVGLLIICLGVVWGVLNTATLPFRKNAAKAFKEPWFEIKAIWQLLYRHVRYLWRSFSEPAKEMYKRNKLERQFKAMEEKPTPKKTRRLLKEKEVEFDELDVIVFFQLLPSLVNLAIITPHLIIAFVGMVSVMGYWKYYDAAQPAEPRPEVSITYEPQIADKQETEFGPWWNSGEVADKRNDPEFINVMLISDTGSVKYSQKYSVRTCNFEKWLTEKVRNPSVTESGQIAFKDQHGNKLTVNPHQVFLFEGYKSRAFAFTEDGTLLAAKASHTKKETL